MDDLLYLVSSLAEFTSVLTHLEDERHTIGTHIAVMPDNAVHSLFSCPL